VVYFLSVFITGVFFIYFTLFSLIFSTLPTFPTFFKEKYIRIKKKREENEKKKIKYKFQTPSKRWGWLAQVRKFIIEK
jgi:hypothetical protein